MSVSLQALRAQQDEKLAKARAEHAKMTALLDALPKDGPEPQAVHEFGYCAEYSLDFAGAGLAETLLTLYPPLPLVNVRGMSQSQKPVKYLRGEELRDAQLEIHPVLRKTERMGRESRDTLIWWTTLASGDVQLHLRGFDAAEGCPDLTRYAPASHSYSTGSTTFYVRLLADLEAKPMPLVEWSARWHEFMKAQGYRTVQQLFLKAIRSQVESGRGAPTAQTLPEPHYTAPGTALAIGPGEELVQSVEQAVRKQAQRAEHPWDRIGSYWNAFSREESDSLVAFASQQALLLPAARQAQEVAEAQVVQVLLELTQGVGYITTDHSGLTGRIEQYLRRKSGWDVRLCGLYDRRENFSFWLGLNGSDQDLRIELDVPRTANGKRLQPQDIEVVYR